MRSLVRLPWITILLGTATLLAWFVSGAADMLALERDAVCAGAWWQTITGHFVHWTSGHLGWDLVTFVVLGMIVESRSRRLLLIALIFGIVAIDAAVWFGAPELTSYRGLSGLDTALFATAVTSMGWDALQRRAWLAVLLPVIALLGFIAKSTVEWTTRANVFVGESPEFVPVPIAHLAGAAVGIAAVLAFALVALFRRGRWRKSFTPIAETAPAIGR